MSIKAVKNTNFATIEAELYNYFNTMAEIKQIEENIIEGSPFQEVCIQSSLGDPTANKALRVMSCLELIELKKRVNAIQKAMSVIQQHEGKMKYMRMKYFDRNLSDKQIYKEIPVSGSTGRRWRREIVELIAGYLGWRV